MFCWLLPLVVVSAATKSEVNAANYSQDISKNLFQQQVVVPSHKAKKNVCVWVTCSKKLGSVGRQDFFLFTFFYHYFFLSKEHMKL